MLFQSFAYGALVATAMGHVISPRMPREFNCGAPEPSAELLAAASEMAEQEEQEGRSSAIQAAINVDTYFHVVATGNSEAAGWISDATVKKQLDVMNSDFAPQGIQFVLKDTTRTVNRAWAAGRNELEMKRTLRKGGYDTLNMYFLSDVSGLLGFCYFPDNVTPGSNNFIRDGCVCLTGTVPGGNVPRFNLGKTATHEIGHWFGLFHTFQGGCRGGDQVADTPAQASPSSGCPVGRDSCPNQAGLDPITNYMDYSDDACYEEFTAGQGSRMVSMWNRFRVGN